LQRLSPYSSWHAVPRMRYLVRVRSAYNRTEVQTVATSTRELSGQLPVPYLPMRLPGWTRHTRPRPPRPSKGEEGWTGTSRPWMTLVSASGFETHSTALLERWESPNRKSCFVLSRSLALASYNFFTESYRLAPSTCVRPCHSTPLLRCACSSTLPVLLSLALPFETRNSTRTLIPGTAYRQPLGPDRC
jgi:hypothetical protein